MKIVRPLTVQDMGSFTRATIGTYVDFDGKVKTAAINTPRFNFNENNLSAGPTLLVETASTNIALYSQQFDNSVWIKNNVAIVSMNTSAPDNTNTAELLKSTGNGRVYQSVPVVGGGTYTFSIWLRTTAGFTTNLSLLDPDFNTVNSAQITVDNIWRRYSISSSAENNNYMLITVGLPANNEIYVWGAQLESGVLTSYIPTSATSVSRAAETNTAFMLSNVPENDAPLFNPQTVYALGNKVMLNHRVYQSAKDGNTGNAPPNATFWVDTGATNRWSMFDQSITSQTTQANYVTVALSANSRIDSLVGLNVNAYSATVNVVDPIYGNVYSRTIILTSTEGIDNWYSYFYEPIEVVNDFVINDLSITYPSATITVSFNGTTVGVGGLVSGLSKEIGITEWGAKVGIVDYSIKTRNNFGDYVVTIRNFSKRADFSVQVPTNNVGSVHSLLASYRGTPIVFIGNNADADQQFTPTIIYGFYKDFSIDIGYPKFCACSIQVEGLT